MHGVQPMPKTTPSSGAPASPVAGRQIGLNCALQERELADEDQAHEDDDDAEDADDEVGVDLEPDAEGPDGHGVGDEDDGEAEHEQGDAEQQAAAVPALFAASDEASVKPPM